MITNKDETKAVTEHISCNCKYKFNSATCNSNQRWNNEKCQCECKNYQKIYIYKIIKLYYKLKKL